MTHAKHILNVQRFLAIYVTRVNVEVVGQWLWQVQRKVACVLSLMANSVASRHGSVMVISLPVLIMAEMVVKVVILEGAMIGFRDQALQRVALVATRTHACHTLAREMPWITSMVVEGRPLAQALALVEHSTHGPSIKINSMLARQMAK
jgi:hypothetical protein